MFRNVATDSDEVGDPPAQRERGQDRPERERTGRGSARGRGSAGRRTRARGPPARRGSSAGPAAGRRRSSTTHERAAEEQRRRRRPPGRPERRRLGAAAAAASGDRMRVADPAAVASAMPSPSSRAERPRVVGVDADVRVAAGGLEDLLDEPGVEERRRRPSSMTDSPNGAAQDDAVRNPARPVVRIRIGWSVRRSQARSRSTSPAPARPPSPVSRVAPARARAGSSRRRRSGRGSPSCGLISAATTAKIAARSGRSRHSSRSRAAGTRPRTSRPGPRRPSRTR